jgi:hypothetical protein
MKPMMYSGLLSDAVDEGLSKLGELPKRAVYEALETDFSMRKKDIPTRFTEFSSILLGNIGPSARPVLEYIVDRFSTDLRTKSLASIDLDESIKRVDMVLKGSINLPNDIDRSSGVGPAQFKHKAAKTTHASLPKVPRPESEQTAESGTPSSGHQSTRRKGVLERTGNRPYAKANSEA